jgi:flagellar motor switch protein FliM
MSAQSHPLTRDELRRLLAGAGGAPGESSAEPPCRPHDWRQCRCFSADQLQHLQEFAGQVATGIHDVFVRFCRRACEVKIDSASQHFAAQVTGDPALGAAGHYGLPFGPAADKAVGVLIVPAKTSRQWTQWLLGGTDAGEESSALSSLEQSLLADLAAATVEALKTKASDLAVVPAGGLVADRWPIDWDPMEELFKIAFSVQRTDSSDRSEAVFVVPCSLLAGVAGRTQEAGASGADAQASQRMMQCLQDVGVTVGARLGTVDLSFHDIMGLAVDDVVVLDQSPQDPVELLIQGKPAFRGVPGRHDGGLAVLITETVALGN